MKLNEVVLLELKDPLQNRFDSYGAWITPTGRVYPVKNAQGHASFLAQHLDLIGLTPDVFQSDNPDDLNMHRQAFEQGFVRVAHPKPEVINFQGMPAALLRQKFIINNVGAQDDVTNIFIDKMEDPSDEGIGGQRFQMPTQRNDMMQYIALG